MRFPARSTRLRCTYNEDLFKAAGARSGQTAANLGRTLCRREKAHRCIERHLRSRVLGDRHRGRYLSSSCPLSSRPTPAGTRSMHRERSRAAQFWQKLIDGKLASPDTLSRTQSEAAASFINGNAAMDIDGPWELPGISKGAKFKWRVALLPIEKTGSPRASGAWRPGPRDSEDQQEPRSRVSNSSSTCIRNSRAWNEFGLLPADQERTHPEPAMAGSVQGCSRNKWSTRDRAGPTRTGCRFRRRSTPRCSRS